MSELRWLERQLEIARKADDRQSEGHALGDLGLAYIELCDAHRAIQCFEQWLVIARETGDRSQECGAVGFLGSAYSCVGNMRRGIELYKQAISVATEIGDLHRVAGGLFNMSLMLGASGDHIQAVTNASAALAICEHIKSPLVERVRQQLAEWRAAGESG